MLSCIVGNTSINCYDGKYDKYTLKEWSEKNRLICPDCGKPYEYCHGKIVPPYFRHKEKSECEGLYHEPETEEHIKGKIALYNWLLRLQEQGIIQNVKLEAYIPETRQRPDLYFEKDGQRCVIEYQCSPIASEFLERRKLYKLAQVNDIWVLGTDKYIYKSEIQKGFNEKVIEKHTKYYFDPTYNIFIFNDISNLKIKYKESLYKSDNYDNQNTRENFPKHLLYQDSFGTFYFISFDNITMGNNEFIIKSEIIENTNKYTIEKNKEYLALMRIKQEEQLKEQLKLDSCKLFLENILKSIEDNYDIYFDNMPSIKLGFKWCGRYFNLSSLVEYPILSFNQIKYDTGKAEENLIFNINVDEKNSINKIIEYLYENMIKDIILEREKNKQEREARRLEEEQKKQEKLELNKIKQENEIKMLNTQIFFVDGNFENLNVKLVNDFKIQEISNGYFPECAIDTLKTFLRRSKQDIQYILVNKTIKGQSVSNRVRKQIINILNEYGLKNVSFYRED